MFPNLLGSFHLYPPQLFFPSTCEGKKKEKKRRKKRGGGKNRGRDTSPETCPFRLSFTLPHQFRERKRRGGDPIPKGKEKRKVEGRGEKENEKGELKSAVHSIFYPFFYFPSLLRKLIREPNSSISLLEPYPLLFPPSKKGRGGKKKKKKKKGRKMKGKVTGPRRLVALSVNPFLGGGKRRGREKGKGEGKGGGRRERGRGGKKGERTLARLTFLRRKKWGGKELSLQAMGLAIASFFPLGEKKRKGGKGKGEKGKKGAEVARQCPFLLLSQQKKKKKKKGGREGRGSGPRLPVSFSIQREKKKKKEEVKGGGKKKKKD